ncbi:BQ2448_2455 [Microbotryum intermedium]|uniref:ribonuclease Z n=1 Tax=Microbotryum intermedium TaxID=269621 RepID=A0A238F8A8_9BASI|nr:BQ2448_2455 [Microbotryum intermedium]
MSNNARYSLSMLSTSSSDSRPALLVTFESQRYLFNTPESISRVCVQNRIGLKRVGHVFAGNLSESAGLPGFILSAVETGNHEIRVVGPPGIDHLLASYRFFTRREKLSLEVSAVHAPSNTLPPQLVFKDSNITVFAVPLTPKPTSAPNTSTSGSTKRRRSSVSSPPARPKSPPSLASSRIEDKPSTSTPIALSFDPTVPDFNPANLRGESASQWRTLVLKDMFRGRKLVPEATPTQPSLPTHLKVGPYNQTPAYLSSQLPPPDEAACSGTVLSYVVVGPGSRGKFLPEEARKRGVAPGEAYKKLIEGERVWVQKPQEVEMVSVDTTPRAKETRKERAKRIAEERARLAAIVDGEGEGTWVEPNDCLGPGQAPSTFLVLNIPSPAYLNALLEHPPSHFTQVSPDSTFKTIFYFLGPNVLHDARLDRFVSRFPIESGIAHRITSPDVASNDPVTFVASALLSFRLSYLDKHIFRLPQYTYLPPDANPDLLSDETRSRSSVTLLRTNDTFSENHELVTGKRVPFRTFDFDIPSSTADIEIARLKGDEKPQNVQDAAQAAWTSYEAAAKVVRQEVEVEASNRASSSSDVVGDLCVTALGTGSAIPSKYRNVSGTLLHLPGDEGYILLDAGEGTWGQIARCFGDDPKEGKEKVLRSIKMIFISHLHQDHHAGLTTVLRERALLSPAQQQPLLIVGPAGVRVYLKEQQELFDLGLLASSLAPVRFIDSTALEAGKSLNGSDTRKSIMEGLYTSTGLRSVTTVPVLHRCRCWGVVITHTLGWRAVFSGDTMPCEALVVAGHGASLLIHEATIEDGLEELARYKGHSTFGQAIDIARRMHAKHLLLTHFSARYPKLPPLSVNRPTASEEEGASTAPVVAIAFDMSTMRLDDFWKFERYRDAMDVLLGWDEATEDEKLDDGSTVVNAADIIDM